MDKFWHNSSRNLISDIQIQRKLIYTTLLTEKENLHSSIELPDLDGGESHLEATYNQLPEVNIDIGYGAIFPTPISQPQRFSWYQTHHLAQEILETFDQLSRRIKKAKIKTPLPPTQKFEKWVYQWAESNQKFNLLANQVRYLEAWVPQLENYYRQELSQGRQPANDVIIHSLFHADPKLLEATREALRPHRLLKRSFLADDLNNIPAGIIVLPIATDIQNRRFLAEVDGALMTHWNQSTWAKDNQIQFVIQWSKVPFNASFAAGKEGLQQHLSHFPLDQGVMTTGALTTHVQDRFLILGPGKITPRTLAHELGHLMGFGDCYFRTLTAQGIFGMGVLEWDNPSYPDDIMCDNTWGEPRVEAW